MSCDMANKVAPSAASKVMASPKWDEDGGNGIWSWLRQTSVVRFLGNAVDKLLDLADRFKDRNPTLFDFIAFSLAILSAGLYVFVIVLDVRVAKVFFKIGEDWAAGLTIGFVVWHYPFLGALLAIKYSSLVPVTRAEEEQDSEFSIMHRRSALISHWLYVVCVLPLLLLGTALLWTLLVPALDILMLCLELISLVPFLQNDPQASRFQLFLLQYRTLRLPLASIFESLPQAILQLTMFLRLRNSSLRGSHFKLTTVTSSAVSSFINLIKNLIEVYLAVTISGRSTMMYLCMAFKFEGAAMLSPRWDRAVVRPVVNVDEDYHKLSLAQQMKIMQGALRRPVVEIATDNMSALLHEHEYWDLGPTAAMMARLSASRALATTGTRPKANQPCVAGGSKCGQGAALSSGMGAARQHQAHLTKVPTLMRRLVSRKVSNDMSVVGSLTGRRALSQATMHYSSAAAAIAAAAAAVVTEAGDAAGSGTSPPPLSAVVRLRTRKMLEFLFITPGMKQRAEEELLQGPGMWPPSTQPEVPLAVLLATRTSSNHAGCGYSGRGPHHKSIGGAGTSNSFSRLPPGSLRGSNSLQDGLHGCEGGVLLPTAPPQRPGCRPLIARMLNHLNRDRAAEDRTLVDVRVDGIYLLPLTDEADKGRDLDLDLDLVQDEASVCSTAARLLQMITHPRMVLYLRHVTLSNCGLDASSCPDLLLLLTSASTSLRSLDLSSNPLFVRRLDTTQAAPHLLLARDATTGRSAALSNFLAFPADKTPGHTTRVPCALHGAGHQAIGASQLAAETAVQLLCPTRLHPNSEAVDCAVSLASQLRHAAGLERLRLSQTKLRPACVRALWSELHLHPSLTSVDISSNPVGTAGAAFIGMRMPSSQLQELYLSDAGIDGSDPGFRSLAAGLLANRSLLRLDLSYNKVEASKRAGGALAEGKAGPALLADALVHNRNLVELILAGVGLTPCGMDELAQGLCRNSTITSIDLSGNRIADCGAVSLARALARRGGTLQRLGLSSANLSGVGIGELCSVLSHCAAHCPAPGQRAAGAHPTCGGEPAGLAASRQNTLAAPDGPTETGCLVFLDLSYNWLASSQARVLPDGRTLTPSAQVQDAVQAIVSVVQHQPLVELRLVKTMMPAAGAALLAAGLVGHRSLAKLDLSCNPLCTEGAEHIISAAAQLPALRSLGLSAANIGSPGFESILQWLMDNSHLYDLDLSQNFIQDCPLRLFWEFCCRNSSLHLLDMRWNNMPDPLCTELQLQFHSPDRRGASAWAQLLGSSSDKHPFTMLL